MHYISSNVHLYHVFHFIIHLINHNSKHMRIKARVSISTFDIKAKVVFTNSYINFLIQDVFNFVKDQPSSGTKHCWSTWTGIRKKILYSLRRFIFPPDAIKEDTQLTSNLRPLGTLWGCGRPRRLAGKIISSYKVWLSITKYSVPNSHLNPSSSISNLHPPKRNDYHLRESRTFLILLQIHSPPSPSSKKYWLLRRKDL